MKGETLMGLSLTQDYYILTHTAVLSDTLDGSLTIVDLERKAVIATVPLFGQAGPVCLDAARNRAFAANGDKLLVLQLENPLPRISGIV